MVDPYFKIRSFYLYSLTISLCGIGALGIMKLLVGLKRSFEDTTAYHLNLSKEYFDKGDRRNAMKEYQKSLSLFEKNKENELDMEAFYKARLWGCKLKEDSRCEKGVIKKLIAITEHRDHHYYGELGEVFLLRGEFNLAKKAFKEAIALKNYARYHGKLGEVFLAMKEFEEAEKELGEAIKLDKNTAWYHAKFAQVCIHKGEGYWGCVEQELEKAIELDKDNVEYHRDYTEFCKLRKDEECVQVEIEKIKELGGEVWEFGKG